MVYHERRQGGTPAESNGGEGGIRTLDTLADILAFQASALGHYATSPCHRSVTPPSKIAISQVASLARDFGLAQCGMIIAKMC